MDSVKLCICENRWWFSFFQTKARSVGRETRTTSSGLLRVILNPHTNSIIGNCFASVIVLPRIGLVLSLPVLTLKLDIWFASPQCKTSFEPIKQPIGIFLKCDWFENENSTLLYISARRGASPKPWTCFDQLQNSAFWKTALTTSIYEFISCIVDSLTLSGIFIWIG